MSQTGPVRSLPRRVVDVLCVCMVLLSLSCVEAEQMKITGSNGAYVVAVGTHERLRFDAPRLRGAAPAVEVSDAGDGWQRLRMTWELDEAVKQDELSVTFEPVFKPDFWWAPHLAPNEGDCIAQHVFRSPAMIAAKGNEVVVIVPDLEICGADENAPWFMDLDAPKGRMCLGLSRTEVTRHVLFRKAPGMALGPGTVELGFFVTAYTDDDEPLNPWRRVSRFLWERYARPLLAKGEPGAVPMDRYVEHTHRWAFETWRDAVWQEFEIDHGRVL